MMGLTGEEPAPRPSPPSMRFEPPPLILSQHDAPPMPSYAGEGSPAGLHNVLIATLDSLKKGLAWQMQYTEALHRRIQHVTEHLTRDHARMQHEICCLKELVHTCKTTLLTSEAAANEAAANEAAASEAAIRNTAHSDTAHSDTAHSDTAHSDTAHSEIATVKPSRFRRKRQAKKQQRTPSAPIELQVVQEAD